MYVKGRNPMLDPLLTFEEISIFGLIKCCVQLLNNFVTETNEFFKYLCGAWEEVTLNIINDNVAITAFAETDKFTEHAKSNTYISAIIITAYSRHKLYEEVLHPLGEHVLYF